MDTYIFKIDGKLIGRFQTEHNLSYIGYESFGKLNFTNTENVKIIAKTFNKTLTEESIICLEEIQQDIIISF